MSDEENGNGNGNGKKKVYMYIKIAAAVVALIIAIGGGMVGMDNRYATAKDFNTLQKQTIATFKQFSESFKRDDLQRKYNFLLERFYRIKDLLRKYPADKELIEDYNELRQQLNALKRKLGM